MRKYFILPAVACIVLILVFLKIFRGCREDEKKAVAVAPPSVQVEAYLVRDTAVAFPIRAVGYLRADEKVDVVSEIPGRVVAILFEEGSTVRKGSVLFQLDDSDYTASLKKNRAQLELAIQAETRSSDLLKSGGTSLHQHEETVSHRKVLEAEGELLMVMIEKAKIRAPFSGKTGIRRVSTGAYLVPGQVLTSLEDLSTLKVEFTVPQDQAGAVSVSDRLEFRVAGNPAVYGAVVCALDPSVDVKTGSLKVLARVLSTGKELVPGTSVTVKLVNQSPVPARFVPTQALIPTPAGYNVYRVAGGKCAPKQVATGLRANEMVEITGGIEPGDTVLLTGFMKVKPGSRVRINKIW